MFWLKLADLTKRLGWLLAIYFILRLVFLAVHFSVFREASPGQLLWAFVIGLRFDLSAIFMVNGLFLLFSLIPVPAYPRPGYQLFLKILFVISNFPFLCLNLIDLEYFKFIGRRTSNELFTITQDIQAQTSQLFINYWFIPLLAGLLLFVLVKWYPETPEKSVGRFTWLPDFLSLLVIGLLSIFIVRGGVQLKPLRPGNAFIQQPAILGHVSLNSTFTFIKSINEPVLEPKAYFSSNQEILEVLNFDPEKYAHQKQQQFKENVVLIILESFASEYTGIENNRPGFTPFFDSLATQGALYRHHYANGRKSIEALPSILAGLPSLLNSPYITSSFQGNEIYGIGAIARKSGYATSFFHGAENGTMGFNTFSRIAGFDQYFGLREYPKNLLKTDFDGQWGILDEPYLQYFARELNKQSEPFLTSVFTLSSHQPYPVPKKYQGKFPQGDLPIHESIGYTDFALRQFFQTAAKQPWYQNTLFVITADHTQASSDQAYQNQLGSFKVPLLLFHPRKKLPAPVINKITQHADIPATIVDYLHLKTNLLLPFGSSVLDTTAGGRAIYFTEENYVLVQPDLVTRLNENDEATFAGYDLHALKPYDQTNSEKEKQAEKEIKALVQYYRNGLINNNLYFWVK